MLAFFSIHLLNPIHDLIQIEPTQGINSKNEHIIISTDSKGGPRWNIEMSNDPWVSKRIDKSFLRKYGVEAVLSVGETQIKAWDALGVAYPDFEGYFRVKTKAVGDIVYPGRPEQVSYAIAIRIPTDLASIHSLQSHQMVFQAESIAQLNEAIFPNRPYALSFYSLIANKSQHDASIPASITLTETSELVSMKIGQKFEIGNEKLEITSISKCKPNEGDPFRGPSQTKINLRSSSISNFNVNAVVNNSPSIRESCDESISVDQDGNIIKTNPEFRGGGAGIMTPIPSLYSLPKAIPSRDIVLYSNVNLKHLKLATFRISSVLRAKLENIPLKSSELGMLPSRLRNPNPHR